MGVFKCMFNLQACVACIWIHRISSFTFPAELLLLLLLLLGFLLLLRLLLLLHSSSSSSSSCHLHLFRQNIFNKSIPVSSSFIDISSINYKQIFSFFFSLTRLQLCLLSRAPNARALSNSSFLFKISSSLAWSLFFNSFVGHFLTFSCFLRVFVRSESACPRSRPCSVHGIGCHRRAYA